ncbi:MAG: hypothetical protein QM783_03555 [Phycisphaerales bacterium]
MARALTGTDLPELYGHCIAPLSDKPRITITTQAAQTTAGRRNVWYIGGQIAESGVERDREAQISAARAEVGKCLPWLSLEHAQWATFRVDRAEGATTEQRRPDTPVIEPVENTPYLAVWPTKLVFAPLVGDLVAAEVAKRCAPSRTEEGLKALRKHCEMAPAPIVAPLPWESNIQWT